MKKTVFNFGMAALCLMGAACTEGDGGEDVYVENLYYMNYEGELSMQEAGGGDRFDDFTDNPFVRTDVEPTSTFSVDADGASYAIMRRYLTKGWEVNPQSVRIEEYLNYFTFDYAGPTGDETLAINAETGACPWNNEHRLLRLGIKGKDLAEAEMPRANFVFLVDVSGSMSSQDKLPLLKTGLTELLGQLRPDDRVSLITYSGEVKKVLESTPVRQASRIQEAINRLSANGCTAGGAALEMAYKEAMENYDPQYNNRIIMGTDGDFNVGVTDTDALVEMVESYARKGIYMTCLGFGTGNLNDAMMERISNAGNGTYHYIDCEDEMMRVFVHERSQFVSVANDVKCQVTFNPEVISEYRLIGYENRVMSNEEFTDDTKDAGEIGAGQTVTALYEVVPCMIDDHFDGPSQDPAVTFDLRYKKTLGGESHPLSLSLTVGEVIGSCERCGELNFAAGVAAYGMVLRQSPYKGEANLDMAKRLISQGLGFDPHGYRAELLRLMEKAKVPTEAGL